MTRVRSPDPEREPCPTQPTEPHTWSRRHQGFPSCPFLPQDPIGTPQGFILSWVSWCLPVWNGFLYFPCFPRAWCFWKVLTSYFVGCPSVWVCLRFGFVRSGSEVCILGKNRASCRARGVGGWSWCPCPVILMMTLIAGRDGVCQAPLPSSPHLSYKFLGRSTLRPCKSGFSLNFHPLVLASVGGSCLQQLLLQSLPNGDFPNSCFPSTFNA